MEIDPAQIEAYQAAAKVEIEGAVRNEPGVLAVYCVSLKDDPVIFRFLEIYTDEDAYRQHINGPYFQDYVRTTKSMILAKRLIETEPVQLCAK